MGQFEKHKREKPGEERSSTWHYDYSKNHEFASAWIGNFIKDAEETYHFEDSEWKHVRGVQVRFVKNSESKDLQVLFSYKPGATTPTGVASTDVDLNQLHSEFVYGMKVGWQFIRDVAKKWNAFEDLNGLNPYKKGPRIVQNKWVCGDIASKNFVRF